MPRRSTRRRWLLRMMRSPTSNERPVLLFLQSPVEGQMRGNTLAARFVGLSSIAALVSVTLGGCEKSSAASDTTRSESAAAIAPGSSDSATGRAITVPTEQLGKLHIEPVV